MRDLTSILSAVERGERQAAEDLLPLVYAELRRMAARQLSAERAGQTLQATALVHEAYLRLVGGGQAKDWGGRPHFFAAAAEAMRRILVESARRKARLKRGGNGRRLEMPDDLPAPSAPIEDVLSVDEALDGLAARDAAAAELVKLHYFAGLTLDEAADVLGVSPRTAYRTWAFARAWLFRKLRSEDEFRQTPDSG
ncbi:ECF-type sigma factor [Paludisphaera rhizosphaerae]|uniref:ECF-type sigma factor n=1 Tax=Paludisphaera rhizosphaerae TaxID=2711216 RepID=UPI0013E9DC87|nr:ECF-type sigma factor [Paludisphaera rhizosphaerae]